MCNLKKKKASASEIVSQNNRTRNTGLEKQRMISFQPFLTPLSGSMLMPNL